jgi:hypothetical protein
VTTLPYHTFLFSCIQYQIQNILLSMMEIYFRNVVLNIFHAIKDILSNCDVTDRMNF